MSEPSEPSRINDHSGESVTWERLRGAHSGMQGTEPWKAWAPNEGHRVYRQSASEACYMCAALARIAELEKALGIERDPSPHLRAP